MTWWTFIGNHLAGTLAVDFFTVPTVTFDVLYVFVVLSLERRQILHLNVTSHPYAEWAAQQIVEAFGEEGAFRLLIRDRDRIFRAAFDQRVNHLGMEQLRNTPRSPRQNGYAERLVGTFHGPITAKICDGGQDDDRSAAKRAPSASIARSGVSVTRLVVSPLLIAKNGVSSEPRTGAHLIG